MLSALAIWSRRFPSQKLSYPAPKRGFTANFRTILQISVRPVRLEFLPSASKAPPPTPRNKPGKHTETMLATVASRTTGLRTYGLKLVATINPLARKKHAKEVFEFTIQRSHVAITNWVDWATSLLVRNLAARLGRASMQHHNPA